MAMGVVIPVLPALVEEFTGSNAKAGIYNGLFVTLWAGMQFIFSPVIGSLSDRYGRRPVILISTAGLAADFALMALAPEPVVAGGGRSEERRVGEGCVRRWRSRWWPDPTKKKTYR